MQERAPEATAAPPVIQVISEMMKLLGRVLEVDLATIYRSMVGLFGAEAVPVVSEALGRLIRDGAIEIETRSLGAAGPLLGYARLVERKNVAS